MLLSELLAGVLLRGGALPPQEITDVVYDSRMASPGALFVCLAGARTDGHAYAGAAYERGCRAFLAARPLDLPPDAAVALCDDPRAAMAAASEALWGHPAARLRLIGITGTKGKTTTALLLAAVLNAAGRRAGYIGSNGIRIAGEPFSLATTTPTTPESRELAICFDAMVRAGCEFCVMEVSSQALKMRRCAGLHFESVLFTNFSPDHIGGAEHPDLADYIASKARLFTDFGAASAVYNADDPMWETIVGPTSARKISCAIDAEADWRAEEIRPYRTSDALGVTFTCVHGGERVPVRLRAPGDFSVRNALSVLALAQTCGVGLPAAAATLAGATVEGRFEIVPGLPDRTFVIDYAHNGLSLTSALSVLREYRPAHLICLFGSVGGRTKGRRAELGRAASTLADLCIVTSDNPDDEPPAAILAEIEAAMQPDCPRLLVGDRAEAARLAVRLSRPGDIVLLAGKGHEDYQLIRGEKVPFCERAILEAECAAVRRESRGL